MRSVGRPQAVGLLIMPRVCSNGWQFFGLPRSHQRWRAPWYSVALPHAEESLQGIFRKGNRFPAELMTLVGGIHRCSGQARLHTSAARALDETSRLAGVSQPPRPGVRAILALWARDSGIRSLTVVAVHTGHGQQAERR